MTEPARNPFLLFLVFILLMGGIAPCGENGKGRPDPAHNPFLLYLVFILLVFGLPCAAC